MKTYLQVWAYSNIILLLKRIVCLSFIVIFFYGNIFVPSTGIHTVANIVLITITP